MSSNDKPLMTEVRATIEQCSKWARDADMPFDLDLCRRVITQQMEGAELAIWIEAVDAAWADVRRGGGMTPDERTNASRDHAEAVRKRDALAGIITTEVAVGCPPRMDEDIVERWRKHADEASRLLTLLRADR